MDLKSLILSAVLVAVTAGATVATLNVTYGMGEHAGSQTERAQCNQDKVTQANASNKLLQAQIQRGNTLQDQLDTQSTRHHQEQTHAQAEIDRLRTSVRVGTVRLSVPTIGAACPASPGHQDAGPVAEPATARTELDPATADALVAITADGDNAIRDLNTCIERYNTVRQSLNAPIAVPQE